MPSNRTITIKGDLGLPTDLPSIMSEIRKLARLSHRTTAEDVRFYALCSRSKSMNETNRAAQARAAKRAPGTATPKVSGNSIAATESEIGRISAKGSHRTMAEDRYLGNLQARVAGLNADQRKADTDLAARAARKFASVRRASATPGNVDPLRATAGELRDAALNLVESEAGRFSAGQFDHLEAMVRESTDNRDAAQVARWVLMTESATYRSAFWKSLRYDKPTYTPREIWTLDRFRETFVSEFRDAAESGSFGLAIPATIDPSIVPSAGETAPVVQLCNRVTLTTNVYKGVASVGSPWAFSAEGSTIADEMPVLAQPVVPIFTAKSFVPASIELTEDYPAWQTEIAKTLNQGYIDLLSQKSAAGSGTGEPRGIFPAMANTTAGSGAAHVVVTTAGSLGAVDMRAAWSALPQRFRASSSWVMHENVLSQIRNLAGAASQVDLVVDRQGTMLMGRPVVTSSYCPDFTGTTGSENFTVLGDLSGYTLATRLGMTVELVPQMRDNSGRPIAERGYLAYARVGADVTVPQAMRLLANS